MELEKQVCSKESGNRLKELGVKQESIFYHCYHPESESHFVADMKDSTADGLAHIECSAFTVAELGDMLPEMVDNLQILTWKKTWREQMTYFCEHRDNVFSAETEAEARAKMLIYLLENKLI